MNSQIVPRNSAAKRYGRRRSLSAAALCSLLVLTACGGDSDDPTRPPGGEPGVGDSPGGKAGSASGPAQPGGAGTNAKPSSSPGLWETLEFEDFPHPAMPLSRVATAKCSSYTSALADYGKPGMVTKPVPAYGPTNACVGWRTERVPVKDLKAGQAEYEITFNCQPVYTNIDQMQDRLSAHLKQKNEAQPTATYSPFYKLPEFQKGYVFSVVRDGMVGSSSVTATYISDEGLCSANFTVNRWTANANGKGLRLAGLDEAETFKEFNLILNEMTSG
ncbi:hypothetical protein [Yinghuangia sp. YIM S10712]|uniref:hypothetical protein n=1 Tax=Yinghuangia sp. YIM S10712 TaxID=3436930 RepID=UPI003F536323